MFSNFFAAECEDVSTPSYLDRIVEAAESAKDRMNEISEEIATTVAENATSAKDAIGEFAITTRESYEAAESDASSPLAALVASAKDTFGEMVHAVGEFAMAGDDSGAEGSRFPKKIISAYAVTAKDAIIEHAIAMKESMAESTMLANEPTYYVETAYGMQAPAVDASATKTGSAESAADAMCISEFVSAATDAVLGGAASAAEVVSDGVASAQETVIESVNSVTVEGVVDGVFSAKDTVIDGAMAVVEAMGESTVSSMQNDADSEEPDENQ